MAEEIAPKHFKDSEIVLSTQIKASKQAHHGRRLPVAAAYGGRSEGCGSHGIYGAGCGGGERGLTVET